jgi:hypothetical protein
MRDPRFTRAETAEVRPPGAEEADLDITRDARSFLAAIRTRIFTFLRALVVGDLEAALAVLTGPEDGEEGQEAWTAERLREALEAYGAGHEAIRLDPEARNIRHTHMVPAAGAGFSIVQQMLVDAEGDCDWVAEFAVDVERSRALGEPSLQLRRIGPLGQP